MERPGPVSIRLASLWARWVQIADMGTGQLPNRRCRCRWSCCTRGGARSARVHCASLLDPAQLKHIRETAGA